MSCRKFCDGSCGCAVGNRARAFWRDIEDRFERNERAIKADSDSLEDEAADARSDHRCILRDDSARQNEMQALLDLPRLRIGKELC